MGTRILGISLIFSRRRQEEAELKTQVTLLMICLALSAEVRSALAQDAQLQRLQYNHPGLQVDLGVGLWAWPLPMDFDGDGDFDLVVSCPDKPYNGTYFFENTEGDVKLPVFKPGVRISKGSSNVQVSYIGDETFVLTPGFGHPDFQKSGLDQRVPLSVKDSEVYQNKKLRAKQWKYVDFDGDGRLDILAGYGDWTEYGWDDAYNEQGEWTNGPLHGYVLLLRNKGTTEHPNYAPAEFVHANGKRVDVFGWPSPNLADFDQDGDLDLLCGEFRDTFTYYQNVGTRKVPQYAEGKKLRTNQAELKMDLQMIVPVAIDWDKDGDIDLICGDEDGRVAFIEHLGKVKDGLPEFAPPVYFQQEASEVKFGALVTPYGVDWDSDGDVDIVAGNTAGYLGLIENLGVFDGKIRWNRPKLLSASGKPIRIQAGNNGSIQGPCESKWGYTTLSVADWNHDGLHDVILNSIWGKVQWCENIGRTGVPELAEPKPIEVQWSGKPPKPSWNWWQPVGKELVTQWRTTPAVVDWDSDGLLDLIMLDHQGELAFFQRKQAGEELVLLPGKNIFRDENLQPLNLVRGRAGKSGRRKIQVVDWDQDGHLDILMNSENADFYRNMGIQDGVVVLKNFGPMDSRKISGHTSSPTVVDFDADGVPELLVGAEDGHLYYKRRD